MKIFLILVMLFAIVLTACTQKKSNDNSEKINEIHSDSLVSCSPRVAARNTENGLISLTHSQVNELEMKKKKLNPELPTILPLFGSS